MNHLSHVFAREAVRKSDASFKPNFYVFYAITTGGALSVIVLLLLMTRFPPVDEFTIALIATLLVSIPATRFAIHLLRVEVEKDVIHSTDYWSVRHSLTWAEIETVEPAMVFGFPYLKAESFRKDHRPLYIPLYLADNEAFREKVICTAAPTNSTLR